MVIKINSYEGRSWDSYIDRGRTFIEIIDGAFPNTEVGNCKDGFNIKWLLESLGHEVIYNYHPIIDDFKYYNSVDERMELFNMK